MPRDPRDTIDSLRDKLTSGERGGSEADRDALLTFSDELDLLSTEYSDYRHLKLLNHCVIMAEAVGGLADAPHDEDAARTIVRWINDTYDNEETNRDYRSAIRVFGKRVTRSDEVPDALEWVPTGTSRSYDPAPDPADMLEWEDDILPMLDACQNSRDAALIALQFDAGLRSGELYELRVADVTDSAHGLRVMVDGKTGERSVPLIPSVPYVNRWLSDHPRRDEPSAPLWCNLAAPHDLVSNRRYLDVFKDAAARADVSKPVTPTNFRRSNTAYLARQGANNALIEDRQGRERGSEHVARYLARFGAEWEDAYASMHGIDVDAADDGAIDAPVECQRCGEMTPANRATCQSCNQALNTVAAESIDTVKESLRNLMVRSDSMEKRREAAETHDRLESDPAFAESVIELHQDGTSPNSSS